MAPPQTSASIALPAEAFQDNSARGFLETGSPAPAAVVGTTLLSVRKQSQNRPAHQKTDSIQERIKISKKQQPKTSDSVTDVLNQKCYRCSDCSAERRAPNA